MLNNSGSWTKRPMTWRYVLNVGSPSPHVDPVYCLVNKLTEYDHDTIRSSPNVHTGITLACPRGNIRMADCESDQQRDPYHTVHPGRRQRGRNPGQTAAYRPGSARQQEERPARVGTLQSRDAGQAQRVSH